MPAKTSSNKQSYLVAVAETTGEDKFALLDEVLGKAGFWQILDTACHSAKSKPGEFSIFIKPDFEFYDAGTATGTDPALVEHLIDRLCEHGYTRIALGDSVGSADAWLDNRDPLILAELVGYRFVTTQGNAYEVVNLSENLTDAAFPVASALTGAQLSRDWLDADFRISFAKNKTDETYRYALGVQNVLHALPMRQKEYHYRQRLPAPDVAVELLRHTPVHFAIIDAFVSNHGSQGSRANRPLDTRTLIAGNDILLADWAAVLKMGLDPYASPLNAKALKAIGLPKKYDITGSLHTYRGWKTPSLLLADSVAKRDASPFISRMAKPWLYSVNAELFPFKNIADEQVNGVLSKFFGDLDTQPWPHWVMVALNNLLGGLQQGVENWNIMYGKDQLRRKLVPLNIDLDRYKEADYESVEDYILHLAALLQFTEPDRNGLKWRYIDGSVLFEYSRILPLSFKNFVQKVDISKAVQMMYDNIGGNYTVVERDREGRPVRQAERDIYLPQPNWMTFFGGKYIDVGKLEIIRYQKNKQVIFWRTVNSSNDSAEFDDGLVEFSNTKNGTLVTIVARQKFALPLFWQAMNMDYFPEVKDRMVSDAYVTFFSRTMANFEAAYEGRETALGQRWDESFGETGDDTNLLVVQQMKDMLTAVAGLVQQLANKAGTNAQSVEIDERGYRHFSGNGKSQPSIGDTLKNFIGDLGEAVNNDVRYLLTNNHKQP